MTSITFYGGINEIGGNKFLVEDRGTRIFLDFGMQMGKLNKYFADFVKPRKLNGMGDLFEFGLLPKIRGVYRKDYSKHTGDDDYKNDTTVNGVLLTHAHLDHAAYIHYLRPEIPIYCSPETKLIMQALEDTGSDEQYITYKENFVIYDNKHGEKSRAKKNKDRMEVSRNIQTIQPYKKIKIDSIEIEAVPVDHSLPGVCGYIVYTSGGTIAYTADLRFHGRRREQTELFVEKCSGSDVDHILCEGTRVSESSSSNELEVENTVCDVVNSTQYLVVVSYPVRDLDRFMSFYNAAKQTGRIMAIDLKQAYLLKLFETFENNVYPKLNDPNIHVYIPRKEWGLLGKDVEYWTEKVILEDYESWEREFIYMPNAVDFRDISEKQNQYIFYCSDYKLQELIDVRPRHGSSYVRSSTEPFDAEMVLDHERIKRWLAHFGLLQKEKDWVVTHVSGHGSKDQIKHVVQNTNSKNVIPIHTEHGEYFKHWHNSVRIVSPDESIGV